MSLPEQYQWLNNEPAPQMIVEALKFYNAVADKGLLNLWAKELGVQNLYSADEIPWCGLFMAMVLQRAHEPLLPNPSWALNWSVFGFYRREPMLGDVLVFRRGTGGHVGLYVGEDEIAYHVLGATHGNCIGVSRWAKARIYAVRRPPYLNGEPANVRKIFLTTGGSFLNDSSSL
jgi:uncharacterized protein (TIGR02594 family)